MFSLNPKPTAIAVAIGLMALGQVSAGELRLELGHLKDSHPLLKASEFAVQAASERVIAAQGGFLPKINITADTGTERLTTQSSSTTPAVDTDFDRDKYSVSIEQNLFNGGRTLGGVRLAQTEEEIKELERKSLFQDVTLEALIAYLQVLRSQLLIELAQANEEITLNQLEMEQKRVEKGSGIAVDELQASTRLQIVRERRVFYEQGMRDALAAYEQVFGRAPNAQDLQDLNHYFAALPADLEAALANGLLNNPKIKLTTLQSKRAEKTLSIEQSSYYPNIDLVGTRNREDKVGGSFSKEEDSVLLKFSWNIFSGGESYRRSRAASFDVYEAQERETNTRRKTSETIRLAWNQYQKGIERLKLLEEASSTSKKVMDGRKKLRDSGKETVLAVLDAEVEYFGVLANMVNAMIDARLGSYRLLHSIGELDMRTLNLETNEFRLPVKPVKDVIRELIGKGHLDSDPAKPPAMPPTRQAQSAEALAVNEARDQSNALANDLIRQASPEPVEAPEQVQTQETAAVAPVPVPTEVAPIETASVSEADLPATAPAEQGDQYLSSIEEHVAAWIDAWSQKDFERYSGFYGERFVTEKFADRDAWLQYRKPRVIGKRSISIEISDLELIQRNDGQLEVQFVQFYQSGGLEVRSRKKLLFGQEGSEWKILWEGNASDKVIVRDAPNPSENTGAPEELSQLESPVISLNGDQSRLDGDSPSEVSQTPVSHDNNDKTSDEVPPLQANPDAEPAAAQILASGGQAGVEPIAPEASLSVTTITPEEQAIPEEAVLAKVQGWAASWSSKDFQRYAEHYSNSFQTSQFGDLESWLAHRKPRILGKPSISVEVSDLVIRQAESQRIEVEFTQRYAGGSLSVKSRKKVILQNEESGLRIVWEGNA